MKTTTILILNVALFCVLIKKLAECNTTNDYLELIALVLILSLFIGSAFKAIKFIK